VRGLENVLMAAKRTPTVKKIIYTSPFFAIGPTDGYVADETGKTICLNCTLDFAAFNVEKVKVCHETKIMTCPQELFWLKNLMPLSHSHEFRK